MSNEKVPDVSVVMSVYNGAASLSATLDSVLAQEGCNFEFIVVDDGSSDGAERILDVYAARDSRLRVIHQANTGLTRALVAGCAAARGNFIARQDAGDASLPGRLRLQQALLRERTDVVLVCASCRVLGPRGELLFVLSREGDQLSVGLSRLDVNHIKGPPHHGTTMFRREAYMRVGGYRPTFVVAQDIDLWLRLAEIGHCWGLTDVGYEATLEANSISGRRRDEQIRLGALAVEAAKVRRAGGSDQSLLDVTIPPVKQPPKPMSKREKAKFLYFIGSCLRDRDVASAKSYFRESVKTDPLFLKALFRSAFG
ncbi:MAG: glycosyltransferase family 2 protein [Aeromicrobium sp.]|nr:glycosyltransferase family 2 protein [Burkholderiales bacterium]